MRSCAIAVIGVALFGCGGSDGTGSEETEVTPDTTTGQETSTLEETGGGTADVLVISAFNLFNDEGEPGPAMDETGSITMDGDPLGTFHSDGRLIHPTGREIASIDADGNVTLAQTGEVIAQIAEDGTMSLNDRTLAFDAEGNVTGRNPSAPGIRIEPADSPSRRAAMLLLLLTLTGEPTEDSGPESVPADTP